MKAEAEVRTKCYRQVPEGSFGSSSCWAKAITMLFVVCLSNRQKSET